MEVPINEIRGAVARGWCDEKNSMKIMDTDLAEAISQEVHKLFIADKSPYLGCATTRELIEELAARAEVSETIGEKWPKYRTVDEH
jgi:hypothetical protein